jgi:hypothetical protein
VSKFGYAIHKRQNSNSGNTAVFEINFNYFLFPMNYLKEIINLINVILEIFINYIDILLKILFLTIIIV